LRSFRDYYGDLNRALSTHSGTLKNLAIIGDIRDETLDVLGDNGDAIDLSSFHSLRNLLISLPAIFRPHAQFALPPNLTQLALAGPGPTLLESMGGLEGFDFLEASHQAICNRLPQLRTLSWRITDPLSVLEEGEWVAAAQKVCDDRGVELDIIYTSIRDGVDIATGEDCPSMTYFIREWEKSQ
jgi:hypothetical protein